jgi:hypothetical protein
MSEKNADKKKSIQPRKVTKAPSSPPHSGPRIIILASEKNETVVMQESLSLSDFWTITGEELLRRWGVDADIIAQFVLDYGLPVRDSETHEIFNIESHKTSSGNAFLKTYLKEGPFNRFLFRSRYIDTFEKQYKSVIEELKKQSVSKEDPGADEDVDKKQPSVPDYIQQRRTDGAADKVIALELYDKNGNFKLSYAHVGSALGLAAGLQKNQHQALKQRGKRLCEKADTVFLKKP